MSVSVRFLVRTFFRTTVSGRDAKMAVILVFITIVFDLLYIPFIICTRLYVNYNCNVIVTQLD